MTSFTVLGIVTYFIAVVAGGWFFYKGNENLDTPKRAADSTQAAKYFRTACVIYILVLLFSLTFVRTL